MVIGVFFLHGTATADGILRWATMGNFNSGITREDHDRTQVGGGGGGLLIISRVVFCNGSNFFWETKTRSLLFM
jgi:hypothetical protein